MNQEETLALWRKGKDAWNAWSNSMLEARKTLEERGDWKARKNAFGFEEPSNHITSEWFSTASVEFSTHASRFVFVEPTVFESYIFPSYSYWQRAVFKNDAVFKNAVFHGKAIFDHAVFENESKFGGVVFNSIVDFTNTSFKRNSSFVSSYFNGETNFRSSCFQAIAIFDDSSFRNVALFDTASFSDDAWFQETSFNNRSSFISSRFREDAWFDKTTFKGDVCFFKASFDGHAGFAEVSFEKYTTFSSTAFNGKAQFSSSNFEATSSFNSAQVQESFDLSGARFSEVPDFRQTHCREAPLLDDVHIGSTIIKQRRLPDAPDFEVTANYRSLKRLAIQGHDHKHEVEFFAEELKSRRLMVYTPRDPNWWLSFLFDELSDYGRSIVRPLMYWLGVVMLSAVHYIAMATPLNPNRETECLAGAGSQVNTAYQLAVAKGLLVPGLADRTIVTQAYDCLFGDIIPGSATVVASIQTLLSAILLFLLLLGIRNRFKLK